MNILAEICIRRPVFAAVLILTLVVLGTVGYQRLGVDEFPNIDIPLVVITTVLPGAAPAEVESMITDKIEGAVNTIAGVEHVHSTSSESVSQVMVEFVLERDLDSAAQDVRDKVNTVLSELPADIQAPIIGKFDPAAAPVLLLALRSDGSLRDLSEIADQQVRRQIENIPGIGQVSLIGARKRQINVWLDPNKLKAFEITTAEVGQAVATQNISIPGGSLEEGPSNLTLRVAGKVSSVEEVKRIIVREVQGRAIRLGDVARVDDGMADASDVAQLDDERTVVLAVRKQAGKNTVAVVDAVKARLDKVQASLPPGFRLEVVRDNSQVIRTGTSAVLEHLLLGAILAAIVVLLFLGNLRSTVIAGIAIPVSIIGTFAAMWLVNYTLNFLTLLALALAVGIVIDDAIVVLENIVRYIDEKGVKPFPAAVLATREIALPVLATTLSLLAVFVPIAFIPGTPGQLLGTFGLTMAISIAISMFVSFTLTPSLSARWLVAGKTGDEPTALTKLVDIFYRPMERAYMSVLRWSMQRRWVIMLASVAVLTLAVPLAATLPKGFIPPDDRAAFEVNMRAPEGTSVEETSLIADRIAREVRQLPGVEHTLITVADDPQQTSNLARIYTFLVDPKQRKVTQQELMDRVRRQIAEREPKNLRISVDNPQLINGLTTGSITYSLSGPDLQVVTDYADRIMNELRQVPGAVDVDSNILGSRSEVSVHIDRDRAAVLGVSVADVATTLRLFVAGAQVSTYTEGGEQYEVRLRADAKFRMGADVLGLLAVPSRTYGSVPLYAVVTMGKGQGPSVINRRGRRPQATISVSNAPGFGAADIEQELLRIVDRVDLPAGYAFEPVGETDEAGKLTKSFITVILMAFILMYLVLAAQFESWLHPITILFALPLTVPFAFLSLYLLGQTLNIFSGLGLLVLFGVVKKNAILQIDHTNHLRAQGKERLEAILLANRDRFRPIMMTTLSFVVGMIPLAFSRGIGSGFSHATSAIVIGGQTLSLLLTLVATPVLYSLMDDAGMFLRRFWRAKKLFDRGESELEQILSHNK